ncbi:MAG: PAS domain S-box protein [Candidatus Methanoperedens sp.]|nr:PAS domain S-box protein [Candidatus Methanoperedens sp.]
MKNEDRTKEQAVDELNRLRTRISELESSKNQLAQTEETLRELEARYKTLTESTGDIIFTLSPDGTVTSLGAAFGAITGWRREQWIGKNFKSLVHPDDLPVSLQVYRRVFSADIPPPCFELRILSKQGDYITVELRVVPQIRNGKVMSYLGIARDITGRRCTEEALRQSEENYRTLIENIQDGIFIAQDEKIKFANQAFARMSGYTAEEIIGKDFREFIAPEDMKMVADRYYRRLAGEDIPAEYEIRALRKDGAKACASVNVRIITYCGKAASMVVVKDITERKRVEEALKKSEEKYRTMIEHSNDLIWMLDRQGNFVYFNKKAEDVSGYNLEDWKGKSFAPMVSPDDLPWIQAVFKENLAGKSRQYEVHVYKKDGSSLILSVNSTPIFESGEIVGTVSFGRDITEHKNAVEQIKEQAALLDKAHDAVIVLNPEHKLMYWNKGAERLYGWASEEVLGKDANTLLYKGASPGFIEASNSVLEKGEWTGELHQVTKDGKEIIAESRWTLMRDSKGNAKSILIINTDVTDKKKIEMQLLRAQRMDSIGRLAGGVAHDLNNVLAPIMQSLQRLQEKYTDEESRKLLGILERNTKRGAYMIRQILLFSRGVEGERRIIRVADLISDVEKVARDNLPESIEITTDMPENIWTVTGDATQLQHVLMNLCMNARDAMPNGGMLGISAENCSIGEDFVRTNVDARTGPYVIISVSDTGTGIPPEIMERIFEPFFTTKEPGKGTGIGLSTSLSIVKSHGGFIDVSSEVGKGTVFRVYLPVSNAGIHGVKMYKSEPSQERGDSILVVDDEAQIREITRQTLEEAGYRVLTAGNGAEAVSLYSQHRKDIKAVLMDMMMPVMDGPACIWVLRKINPDVRIIAVSGITEDDKFADLTGTVHAFLKKPYTAETLLDTIREVIGR